MSGNSLRSFANLPSLDEADTQNHSELPVHGYLAGPIDGSLSPTNDVHCDLANDPGLSSNHGDTATGGLPSPDDIIDWSLDQSYFIGDLGSTFNFPTADTFLQNPYDDLDDGKGDGRDLLEAAAIEMEDNYELMLQRMDIMESNEAIKIQTEREVDQRLLAAGKTQKEIDHSKERGTILRHKIEDLYLLEKQRMAIKSNVAPAFLLYGSSIDPKIVEMNLRIDGSLSEFRFMVKNHLKCLSDPWTPFQSIYHEDRPWKYFFQSKMQSEKSRPLILLDEEREYKKLIHHIKAPTTISLDAVLTQEDWPGHAKHSDQLPTKDLLELNVEDIYDDTLDDFFEDVDIPGDIRRIETGKMRGIEFGELLELASERRTGRPSKLANFAEPSAEVRLKDRITYPPKSSSHQYEARKTRQENAGLAKKSMTPISPMTVSESAKRMIRSGISQPKSPRPRKASIKSTTVEPSNSNAQASQLRATSVVFDNPSIPPTSTDEYDVGRSIRGRNIDSTTRRSKTALDLADEWLKRANEMSPGSAHTPLRRNRPRTRNDNVDGSAQTAASPLRRSGRIAGRRGVQESQGQGKEEPLTPSRKANRKGDDDAQAEENRVSKQ